MNSYDVLGEQVAREVAGADSGGLDASALINAAAELTNRGVTAYTQSQAAKASAADADAKAQAVVALDAQATSADAQVTYQTWVAKNSAALASVNPSLSSQATADQAALSAALSAKEQAFAAEAAAGIGLPPDASTKRVKAANDAAQKAVAASLAAAQAAAKAPSDVVKRNDAQLKAALASAAQATAARAAAGSVASAPPTNQPPAPHAEPSFFKAVRWGAPTYVWFGVGGVLLTGVGLLVRSLLRSK